MKAPKEIASNHIMGSSTKKWVKIITQWGIARII